MNITKENIDELNAVLSISLAKEDYEERVNTVLQDYRKKARIDGFRPGKVPLGLVRKMYRTPILVEEINKLVSESISKFLVDEKLNVLGEPLPNEEVSHTINWDEDEQFEFKFDLGLAPEFELKITPKDKIPLYSIKIDDALISKYMDSYLQRFGQHVSADKATEKDLLKVDVQQLNEDNSVAEEGIKVEDVSLSIEMVKDEKIRKQFLAVKKGDKLNVNLKKAYPSDAEVAALLKIDKAQVAELNTPFELSIKDISHFENAKADQELFDKIYGPGNVKSEAEFKEKIAEEAKKGTQQDSEYRFRIDAKETLTKKVKISLPEKFLKRWLLAINEGKFTAEQIDKDFDSFAEDLKWQLIRDKVATENKMEVSEEDMKAVAREIARMQFAQYGMANVPDEHLDQFVSRMFEKKEDVNNIHSRVIENKIFDLVRATAKVDEKEISVDKFNKLFEK